MYRINANIAWLAMGLRFAAFADLRRLGLGLFKVTPVPGVGDGLSQVVQIADGYRGKPGVLRLSKDITGPLTQLLDRRTAGCAMALIHRCQQADILRAQGVIIAVYHELAIQAFLGPDGGLVDHRPAALGQLSEQGLERSREFSWDRAAVETLAVLEAVR